MLRAIPVAFAGPKQCRSNVGLKIVAATFGHKASSLELKAEFFDQVEMEM